MGQSRRSPRLRSAAPVTHRHRRWRSLRARTRRSVRKAERNGAAPDGRRSGRYGCAYDPCAHLGRPAGPTFWPRRKLPCTQLSPERSRAVAGLTLGPLSLSGGHDEASPTPKTRAIRQPSRGPTSLPGLRRGSNPEAGNDLSDHRLLTARRGSRCRRSPRSMWLWSAGRRLSSRDRSRKNQPGQTG